MNVCAKTMMLLPWVLLCLHIVCWWCLHCWPTWSDKSCSIWEAEAALEASRPVSSAAGRKRHFFSMVTLSLHQWERLVYIHFHELQNLHLYLNVIQEEYGAVAGFLESWKDYAYINNGCVSCSTMLFSAVWRSKVCSLWCDLMSK